MLKIYRHSIKDKKIGLLKEIYAGNDIYYLEITISEEDVLKSITGAQQTIYLLFVVFLIFIFWSFYYVIHKISVPFNYLEDSIIKIANGDLDTNIDIQKQEILYELSIAIKKMTNQLKNQIIRLKQLEEYKTEFIQNVSHEIKTPITAINIAMELIQNEDNSKLTPQMKECFDILSFQVQYMNSLVNDILSLAELEDEKVNNSKPFTYFVINNTVKRLIDYIKPDNIKINFKENDTINLFGDEELVYRAISNIVTNAIKYSGTEKIDIILENQGNNCVIQIADYGIGIEEQYQDKIFEKFYRIDKSRSRKNGGTGLGLSIVKNIIELHNGEINLISKKNEGCNFIIKIPII